MNITTESHIPAAALGPAAVTAHRSPAARGGGGGAVAADTAGHRAPASATPTPALAPPSAATLAPPLATPPAPPPSLTPPPALAPPAALLHGGLAVRTGAGLGGPAPPLARARGRGAVQVSDGGGAVSTQRGRAVRAEPHSCTYSRCMVSVITCLRVNIVTFKCQPLFIDGEMSPPLVFNI